MPNFLPWQFVLWEFVCFVWALEVVRWPTNRWGQARSPDHQPSSSNVQPKKILLKIYKKYIVITLMWWAELLRSKFKRSTQKLSSILTDFDLDDIEDQALGQQKMNWVFRSTLFNVFYVDVSNVNKEKQLIVDLINLHFSVDLISLSNVN